MKNFKFLRGDEDESQIISQYEWNRRRDALAERIRQEENRRENNNESKIMINNLLNSLEEPKLSFWIRMFLKISNNRYVDYIPFYLVLFVIISFFIYGLYKW